MTRLLLAALALSLAACSSADLPVDSGVFSPVDLQRGLPTRAEATDFEETSSYEDVMGFLATMDGLSDQIYTTTFGTSVEGRDLPLAIWSASRADSTAEAVRQSGKTRVLVFANIHAGEVAGKEAALMLLRDLANGAHAEWADSLVVMIAPIYNADGNERVAYGNRPLQWGPVGGMGQRPNAQGLDLNRDFMKLASPEARALVGLIRDADPHVVLDLHTTNGTHMGYHLTYAPPLSPNTPAAIDAHLREEWLPQLTAEILRTDDMATEHYGNVPGAFGENASSVPRGWYSFSGQPRFSTNYTGIRGRYGLLSEAYSYASFEDRVTVSKRFVEEVLAAAYRDASRVRATTAEADRQSVVGQELAVRAGFTAPNSTREILLGAVDTLRHPETGDRMYARRDVRTPETMPVFSRFGAAETERVPAGYLVPARLAEVIDLLAAHGVQMTDVPAGLAIEEFQVDSVRVASRPFQNVRQQEAFGRWAPRNDAAPSAGGVYVPMDQPLARVAFLLLEPRSDDSVVNWALVSLEDRGSYPILRVPAP